MRKCLRSTVRPGVLAGSGSTWEPFKRLGGRGREENSAIGTTTVLIVLVEQAERIMVAELDEFIRTNNPYNQRIFIIGGSTAPGNFKIVPWYEVTKPYA